MTTAPAPHRARRLHRWTVSAAVVGIRAFAWVFWRIVRAWLAARRELLRVGTVLATTAIDRFVDVVVFNLMTVSSVGALALWRNGVGIDNLRSIREPVGERG